MNEPTAMADHPAGAQRLPIHACVAVGLPYLIYPDPDGGYTAEVPALPGCITEAETLEELAANVREAAEGWLLARQDVLSRGWPEVPE